MNPTTAPNPQSYTTGGGTGFTTYNPGTQSFSSSTQGFTNPSAISSQISKANNTSSAATTTPVINATTAQNDLQSKVTANQNLLGAISQQSATKANNQTQENAANAAAAQQANENNSTQQGLNIQQTQANAALTAAQAKQQAVSSMATPASQVNSSGQNFTDTQGNQQTAKYDPTTGQPLSPQTAAGGTITPSQSTLDYITGAQGIQDESTQAVQNFLTTSQNMIVGLQDSESALVSATTAQFQSIINAQMQSNASQVGAATEAAARTGQEYAPGQATGNIAAVINQGNQRLADINSTMASTIADLQTNFAKEEYSMMNDNFDKLEQNFTDRLNTFKDIHDAVASDAAAQLKAQQDAQAETDKQTQMTEQAKKDAADIQNQQNANAIADAHLKIDQATYNATYGMFMNPDGTPNTNVNPSNIPGYTSTSNGLNYVANTSGLYKTPSIGGIPVLSAADAQQVSGLSANMSTINQMQTLWQQANNPGAFASLAPAKAEYNSLLATLPINVQATLPKPNLWSGTPLANSSAGNTQFYSARKLVNTDISSINSSLKPAPYGQIFTDPQDAQNYMNSIGETNAYADAYSKAQQLSRETPTSGQVLQIINGQ